MPNQRSIIKKEYSELAFQHTDIGVTLIYNMAFPGFGIDDETGIFREGAADEWFEDKFGKMTKFTTAEEHGESDSQNPFNLTPSGIAWKYSELDLEKPQKFGSSSRQEMIQKRIRREATLLKKKKEKGLYTFVADNNNFVDATFFANATTAWSNHATADPVADVYAGRLIVDSANALIIPWRSYVDLKQSAKLQSMSGVVGPKRGGSIDPTITIDWLKNVFELDHVFVSRGKLKTDSSDPAATAKSDIWGNKALLYTFNPNSGSEDGNFLKHLYLKSAGASSDEGWIVTEKFDPEPGLKGVTRWQLGSYYQYLSQRAEIGYRIDALYA